MRGNRTILIVVLLVLVVVGGLGGFFLLSGDGPGAGEPKDVVEAPVITTTQIVVSAQDIPKGMQLQVESNAVTLQEWPNDSLPESYFTAVEEVQGKYARVNVVRGRPMTKSLLADAGDLPALFEHGRVAYAIPMDTQGGVAWAIGAGDHVDVLAALQLMAVDPEFQSPLPNRFQGLNVGEEFMSLTGIYGRFETLPNGQPALVYPAGELLTHLVVQMTVQDAIVWHVGVWDQVDETGAAIAAPVATGDGTGDAIGGIMGGTGGGEAAAAAGTLPSQRQDIEPVTLLVTRQDAVVLKYLLEMGADLDLVLRPAGETATAITQPVWLLYILDKYQLPNSMPELPVAGFPVRMPLELKPIATPIGEGVEE
ncbi:MAG: Flp pilus assembly protein CpaB [Anaerolineae bacterium]|nr:Flp pilus assembly protein CpaB [Anaerolineae bacterium]